MGWEWQEQVPSGKFSEESNWMGSEVAGLQTHYHRKWYRLDATWEEKNVGGTSARVEDTFVISKAVTVHGLWALS